MSNNNLKYTDILKYVLIMLYWANKSTKGHLSLPAILSKIDYSTTFSDATEMADYFETKGFAKIIRLMGDVLVQITPSGKIYVEAFDEEMNHNFDKFLEKKIEKTGQSYAFDVIYPQKNPKEKVINLINSIKNEVEANNGNDIDSVKDLEIIKLEIEKHNPDYRIMGIKIEELTRLDYAIESLSELRSYVEYAQV